MKLWFRKVSSLFLASVLTVSLNGKAYAQAEQAPLPETPPEIVEPAASEQEMISALETILTQETTPTLETTSTQGTSSTEDSTPTQEITPKEETTSTEETAPVQETTPTEETTLVEEMMPTMLSAAPTADLQDENPTNVQIEDEALVNSGDEVQNLQNTNSAVKNGETDLQITVAGTELKPDESNSEHWDEVSGSGWRYDAEDQSLVLVNYDGQAQSIATTDSDITIKAAGVNRLASLKADGSVNLIGTGILLVDEIELSEDGSFNLQTNTAIYEDGTGSVAVFLKQEDGSYLLINGSVDGLLDEAYTLPAGVTLVVPGGSRLVMQSLAVGEYTSPEGETATYYSTEGERDVVKQLPGYESDGTSVHFDGIVSFECSTAAKLTISEQATLVIQDQAALVMNSISQQFTSFLTPLLEVFGTLELGGSVSDGLCTVGNTGDVNGDGCFSGTTIGIDGGRTDAVSELHVEDSLIRLNGNDADLGNLKAEGDNKLIYSGNASIDTLDVEQSGTLMCVTTTADYGSEPELSVVSGISGGGTIRLESGVYILEENCAVIDGTTFLIDGYGDPSASSFGTVTVYDYHLDENDKANLGWNSDPRVETGEAIQDGNGRIQIDLMTLGFVKRLDGSVESNYTNTTNIISPYIYEETEMLSYSKLVEFWEANEDEASYYWQNYVLKEQSPVIVLETETDGVWSSIRMTADNPGSEICASDVRRIRLVEGVGVIDGGGGGTATTTNLSFTGSGQLGTNAGSVTGGVPMGLNIPAKPHNGETGGGENGGNNGGENGGNNGNTGGAHTGMGYEETDADSHAALLVWTEPEKAAGEVFTLHVVRDGQEVMEINGSVEVSFDYTSHAGTEGKMLYVVFRNGDGSLTAIRADYDPFSGRLHFMSPCVGRFVVLGFDFDGEEYSEEFYRALAACPELDALN